MRRRRAAVCGTLGPGLADLFAVLPGIEREDGVILRFAGSSAQLVVCTLNSLSAVLR
jgi:D-amino peptidase